MVCRYPIASITLKRSCPLKTDFSNQVYCCSCRRSCWADNVGPSVQNPRSDMAVKTCRLSRAAPRHAIPPRSDISSDTLWSYAWSTAQLTGMNSPSQRLGFQPRPPWRISNMTHEVKPWLRLGVVLCECFRLSRCHANALRVRLEPAECSIMGIRIP